MVILTKKEIGDKLDLEFEAEYPCSDGSSTMTISVDKLLKSQIKKVAEWGDELCTDRHHSGTMHKRECGFCWQSLIKEIGE